MSSPNRLPEKPSPFVQRVILVVLSAGAAIGAFYLDGPSAAHLLALAAGLGMGAGTIRRPGDAPAAK